MEGQNQSNTYRDGLKGSMQRYPLGIPWDEERSLLKASKEWLTMRLGVGQGEFNGTFLKILLLFYIWKNVVQV